MQANNQPEAEAAERLAGARVTDDNIIELAVSHSNYRAEKHIGDCDDFEVISHRRLVEFGRALLALAEPAGEVEPVATGDPLDSMEERVSAYLAATPPAASAIRGALREAVAWIERHHEYEPQDIRCLDCQKITRWRNALAGAKP